MNTITTMETVAAKVVGPRDGQAGFLGSIGVPFRIDGEEAATGSCWSELEMNPDSAPGVDPALAGDQPARLLEIISLAGPDLQAAPPMAPLLERRTGTAARLGAEVSGVQ